MICSCFRKRGLCLSVVLSSITFSVICLGLTLSDAIAGSYRHHEAHEHGAANLNIAVEGSNLYIELNSPAANIVGFEHRPKTKKQKAAVADALERLKEGAALFLLPTESAGRMVKVDVHTDMDHQAEHHDENSHAGEQDRHQAEKEKHMGEQHETDKHEQHSEFKATYHFICKKPSKLSHIVVKLFNIFPGIEQIEVQLLAETKQTAVELTAENHTIMF